MTDKLKTDIRSFKPRDRKPVLVTGAEEQATPTPKEGAGRPPKPKAEKRGERITLSLTAEERAVVSEKAGMVPEATWLLNELKKAGVFDPE